MTVQHGDAARHVEAADGDRNPGLPQRAGDVERAWILVRLHADQRDEPEIVVAPQARDDRRHVDAGVGFVDRIDIELDIRSQHPPLGAVDRAAVH